MRKSGFVIRSTIEDLLLGYGKLAPEKSVKNTEWPFSTDSSLIARFLDEPNSSIPNVVYRAGQQGTAYDFPID